MASFVALVATYIIGSLVDIKCFINTGTHFKSGLILVCWVCLEVMEVNARAFIRGYDNYARCINSHPVMFTDTVSSLYWSEHV